MTVIWNNAAETWVDILPRGEDRLVSFASMTGTIDLILFGSTAPKLNQKKTAVATGFPPLPPWWAIGFHYSDWGDVSDDILSRRNYLFS